MGESSCRARQGCAVHPFLRRTGGVLSMGNDDRGFALIMTLWVMVFLVVIVTSFALNSRWSLESTTNFKEETEAYYLALSGYDLALDFLMNDADMQIDYIDGEGRFHADKDHQAVGGRVSLFGGDVEIRITDEQSKWNINILPQDKLRQLLRYVGVAEDVQDELSDSLMDWIDPDALHHVKGAEDEYYREFGYRAKNKPLDTVEELLLVKGFSEDLLYGSERYQALSPYITVHGNNLLNVNTVSPEFMRMLGVSEIDIENVLSYRDTDSGGLTQVPSELVGFGINATMSSMLRVEVSAAVREGGVRYVITAVVRRIPAGQGFKLETVSWRENVLYS